MSGFIFREGAAPATPTTEYVHFYAKANGLLYYKADDGIERALTASPTGGMNAKTIIIENPTDTEDLSFFFTDIPLTVTKIRAILVGTTPSVTWSLRHASDRSAVGAEVIVGGTTTTAVTTGIDIEVFDDPDLSTDSFTWLETTAKSGVVLSLALTLFYDEV